MSGKIARGELPPPGRARPAQTTPFSPPRDEIEHLVALVWATVLDLEEIGINDQFLDVGGDSLAAMRIAALVIQAAHVELPMAALLATATVAEMSTVLRDHAAAPRPPV
jgi:acyl carrier protein